LPGHKIAAPTARFIFRQSLVQYYYGGYPSGLAGQENIANATKEIREYT
jgi:hypothetical protein